MSGLETAIRNALEKSDRTNPEIRARIYQSARQALDSGLTKQGITDSQIITAQRQRLELKIREIESEERQNQMPPASPAHPSPSVPSASVAPEVRQPISREQNPASSIAPMLGGATRDHVRASDTGRQHDVSSLDILQADRVAPPPEPLDAREPVVPPPQEKRRGAKDATTLDAPPERTAKPRRRRGFLSVLFAWLVFFALVGAAVWWAYSSGLIQQSLQQALNAADQANSNRASGSQRLEPQAGFSEEWVDVFEGDAAAAQAGSSATAEAASTPRGPAVRLTSGAATAEGDVAISVPAEVLQQLAGKSSTIALTVQSATEQPVQFSVRCDFGSLGGCARHRFSARQEQADVLLRVTFETSAATSGPGRLLLNTALEGADHSVLVHSVRVLPGQ